MNHLPKIILKAIPHKKQRYNTPGDYFKRLWHWNFRVSKMNAEMEMCVLIHELVEWTLTERAGIKEKDISKFDIMFEKEREQGLWEDEEPGDDPRCIYSEQHQAATKVERIVAEVLGVDWEEYTNTCL